MLLNHEQIEELLSLVDYYTSYFIGKHVGPDMLTGKDKSILRKYGVDYKTFLKKTPTVELAFKFGMLAAVLRKDQLKSLTLDQLKKVVKEGKFLPLTRSEKYALEYVKTQSYSDVKGLGNRIGTDMMTVFIESSKIQREKYQNSIRKELIAGLKNRYTVKQVSIALGKKTKDWSRDFDRIADYEMHSAYQQGIATELLKTEGGEVEIFFSVYKDACEHCKEIYLLDQNTKEPRIFKLRDVIQNGSNIGRKVKDWTASVDPIHPFCRCTMHIKPANSVWDAIKQQFILIRNTYGVNRKSKIIITKS